MSGSPTGQRLAVLADEIRAECAAATADFQSAVQHAITAGDKLIEARKLAGHGNWLRWLEENFDGTAATARTYMRLAANRKRVFDLPSIRQAAALLAGRMTADDEDDLQAAMGMMPVIEPEPTEATYGATDEELDRIFANRSHDGPLRQFVLMYQQEVGAEVESMLTRLAREWGVTGARDVFLEALRRATARAPYVLPPASAPPEERGVR